MEIVVLFPFRRDDSAELTRVSDSASRADVAIKKSADFDHTESTYDQSSPSSKINMSGFLRRARAIAIRCF